MHLRWNGRDGCGHSSPWAIFGSSPAGIGNFAFGRHALCGGLRVLGRYGSLRVMLGLARIRTSSLRWHSLLCRGLGLGFAVHPQVRVFPALSAVGWACCGGCVWGAAAHCMFLATRRPRRYGGGAGRQVYRCMRMRGLYTVRGAQEFSVNSTVAIHFCMKRLLVACPTHESAPASQRGVSSLGE